MADSHDHSVSHQVHNPIKNITGLQLRIIPLSVDMRTSVQIIVRDYAGLELMALNSLPITIILESLRTYLVFQYHSLFFNCLVGLKFRQRSADYHQDTCATNASLVILCFACHWFIGMIAGKDCWMTPSIRSVVPFGNKKASPQGGSIQVSSISGSHGICSQSTYYLKQYKCTLHFSPRKILLATNNERPLQITPQSI